MKRSFVAFLLLMFVGLPAFGETPGPAEDDKCPVCGMLVAKYQDWLARVDFKDGSHVWFDGPKDMFKFVLEVEKYSPGKSAEDIASIEVTEYYGLSRIDARGAFFVTGGDVYGPMGKELIPFKSREDAEGFARDHKGKAVLTFGEITMETIKGL